MGDQIKSNFKIPKKADSYTDCTRSIKIYRFTLKPGCIWEIGLYFISKFLKKNLYDKYFYTIICITASDIQRGTFPQTMAMPS